MTKPTTPKGLTFKRTFSSDRDPYDEKHWEYRTVTISDDSGREIFKQENVEVPADWSELATKIAVSKYFHGDNRKGDDPYRGGRESSIKHLITRVTKTIAMFGKRDNYFATDADAATFEKELKWLCLNQYGAFNSPVWFNVGLHHEYGFGSASAEGNYIYNRESGRPAKAKTQYEYPQGSACFIQKVEDDLDSIMNLCVSEAMLFKFGSGTGTDLSTLRSMRERLSGGGKPSGPLSFLRIYDAIARVVKSGGKTRRAAKMNTLNTWHPDIEEFIMCKQEEELKAHALIDAGYDGSFNGPAYDTVAFQNENLSVRADDNFMDKASGRFPEGDERALYDTIAVVDKSVMERKDARKMLRLIAESAWFCGDPGMQFDTTIQAWHTCSGTEQIHSTNPCSEYVFLDNTACNLASLNLMKFRTLEGGFDLARFRAACRIFITAQDIIVDNASYPTPAIAANSHIFRTLGLGYANLGALLMSYGLPYDSQEGRSICASLTAIMTGEAYAQSALMAQVTSPFDGYHDAKAYNVEPCRKDNVDSMKTVIEKHLKAAHEITTPDFADSKIFSEFKAAAVESWDTAHQLGLKHGYRNAQVTVLAPTGTIGFLMDCDTTGIEPAIGLVGYKTLAGGGMLKLVNRTVQQGLRTLGYTELAIEQIVQHIKDWDTIEDVEEPTTGGGLISHMSGLKPEHLPVFDCAFKADKGTRSLHYRGHLGMMAAAQPFLSGAISKTVNLPNSATVDDMMNAYVEAWKLGLKAVALYRDGSKRSAPLNMKKNKDMGTAVESADEELKDQRIEELQNYIELLEQAQGEPVRKHLPATRIALNHRFEISGHEGYINVGMFEDGSPGEVFISMSKEGSTIGGLMDTLGIMISVALQYGVPLDSLVKKFAYQRFEPSGWTKNPDIRNAHSIVDYVFRWLGCQFIEGFRESTAPSSKIEVSALGEVTLDMPGKSEVVVQMGRASGKTQLMNPDLFKAFLPDPCQNCGSAKVIRAGACGVCTECGTSQGCS